MKHVSSFATCVCGFDTFLAVKAVTMAWPSSSWFVEPARASLRALPRRMTQKASFAVTRLRKQIVVPERVDCSLRSGRREAKVD